MMAFNIVTIFSTSERNSLKKAFQADQKKKALLAAPVYTRYSSSYSGYKKHAKAVTTSR